MSVRLQQLRKRYIGPDGSVVPVIDVESFDLIFGEQVALMGSSGSGKTTLLHLIAGILTPDEGKILFDVDKDGTVDIASLGEPQRDVFRGRHIGYIFQTHHLLPGFTALENVLLGMSFTGRAHEPAWAKHLLEEVGLSDRLNYKPAKLSVGQQQRVAVARALANRPKLVLADEPTGALDAKNAQQVLELIRKLCGEVGASLLIVTHDKDIASQLPKVVSLAELKSSGIVMNIFQLILKQMRQRALGTWLTLLSVMLGVALASGVFILRRGADRLFGQNEFGYDIIVGSKRSPLQLVLNTVYHVDRSPGNIPYSVYEAMSGPQYRGMVKIAVPWAVGDSYKDHRIVGTSPKLFGLDDAGQPLPADKVMEYRPGQKYEMADGRVFHGDRFEAIIGSDISARTGLKLGDTFQATHGLPQPGETPDVHKPQWAVVGVLKQTHTANDRVIFIPLVSFYTIAEHETGLFAQEAVREGKDPNQAIAEKKNEEEHDHEDEHYTVRADGTIDLHLPKNIWGLSAVLVKTRGSQAALSMLYTMNNSNEPALAVNPATTMREFFATFLQGSNTLLLVISLLVSVVASVSILVSIYNSVSARMKEIAILRALGAMRRKILMLICLEAGLVGAIGAVLGLIVGHLLGAVASVYFNRYIGERIDWLTPDPKEWQYLAIVVAIALLAGLVPAMKAYRSPVATNLVAG